MSMRRFLNKHVTITCDVTSVPPTKNSDTRYRGVAKSRSMLTSLIRKKKHTPNKITYYESVLACTSVCLQGNWDFHRGYCASLQAEKGGCYQGESLTLTKPTINGVPRWPHLLLGCGFLRLECRNHFFGHWAISQNAWLSILFCDQTCHKPSMYNRVIPVAKKDSKKTRL